MSLLAFIPHGPELLVVAGIALLIFGNRLPSVMRSLGRSVTEFKKGVAGIEDEIEQATTMPPEKKTNVPPANVPPGS